MIVRTLEGFHTRPLSCGRGQGEVRAAARALAAAVADLETIPVADLLCLLARVRASGG